ncbi:hypothetical protein [Jiella sonneratiae]|uniref:Lipoprotein n=1 Tax=Jiella sonneratiae TaxID=2816856 RepID=A0ABS3J2K0_9HYPH|nr:hypothetical protein [Jiella sonneratiae]MBO0903873.1 hypothetical protein [Jiella sonneratiae]
MPHAGWSTPTAFATILTAAAALQFLMVGTVPVRAAEEAGLTLRTAQVPTGNPGNLAPDVAEAMTSALRAAAGGGGGGCPGGVPPKVTVSEASGDLAEKLREAGSPREADLSALAAGEPDGGLLLAHSLAGTGYADGYTGLAKIAAELRYGLFDGESGRMLAQGSSFSQDLDGGECDPAGLSEKASEADRKAAAACFEAALASHYPTLLGDLPAEIVAAATCPSLATGPVVVVAVDGKPKAALRAIYYEDAVLDGMRRVAAGLAASFPKITIVAADGALADRFARVGDDAKTSEADIAAAAATLEGRADYLLVQVPTAGASADQFTGLLQLEAAIAFKLYDVKTKEFVADGTFEASGVSFTGCAADTNGREALDICVRHFVAGTLQTLARKTAERVVFTLMPRSTAK